MVYSVNNQKSSVFSARYRWQVIATMTVHIMTFTHGVGVGWLAPSLPLLGSEETPLDKPISIDEISWVGSLIGLGALTGNIIFGLLLDRLGRKLCMYLLAIPNMIYWILIYSAQDVTYLYAGRFLAGVSGGGCYVVLPIFVAEISDNNVRGALSSMAMMYVSIGMIVGFSLASYLSYYLMPCIAIAFPVIYLLAIIGLSETPQYLLRQGRDAQAEKSFYFYKNLHSSSADNESAYHDSAKIEFETFRQQVLSGGVKQDVTWKDFFNWPTLKIFGLNFTLLVSNQLSGSFALFNYTSHIFGELETQIEPNTCTIIVGAAQVVGILCAVALVDRLGRRVMLLTSMGCMGLGELGIGLLSSLAPKEFLAANNWLSLLLMCFVAFIASVGVIPLIFIIIIENLPAKIRSIGTSICMATLSAFIFVSLKIYPLMIFGPGLAATMYMSAGVCAIGFTILGLFLPETKGKLLTH
ncbi:facilitated trehalose transporter Tret1-like [Drosophila sulfurigaster albostrigata]|uniref:facilitated trehalose transporter Tret1-like n=1 Tax=Drosophila sulfurigaster albostrigata TaxID=89887 RepID=UPI002D218346|nr:facilitated trehalose transporter Tret1-like [Drosophila sulfurigaster albostrigata]